MLLNVEQYRLLKELTELNGISGNENEVRNYIVNSISEYCDKLKVDNGGNVIAFIKGNSTNEENSKENSMKIMLSSHMDEVGFIITGIDKNGCLRFKPVGGMDDRILPGKRVVIGKERIKGVIGSKPIHLQSKEEFKKTFKPEHLRIDIGTKTQKEAQELINLGDFAAFDTQTETLGTDCIVGKAFDDRVGCAILIELIKNIERPPFDLYICFSTREEIGLIGAKILANNVNPDIAIIIEGTTCNDVPGISEHEASSFMGKGPVLTIMDKASVSNKELNKFIKETAEIENISIQYKNTVTGGNDAGAIHKAGAGVKTASISVPCRYIHSPLSVINSVDYINCLKLTQKLVERLSLLYPEVINND